MKRAIMQREKTVLCSNVCGLAYNMIRTVTKELYPRRPLTGYSKGIDSNGITRYYLHGDFTPEEVARIKYRTHQRYGIEFEQAISI